MFGYTSSKSTTNIAFVLIVRSRKGCSGLVRHRFTLRCLGGRGTRCTYKDIPLLDTAQDTAISLHFRRTRLTSLSRVSPWTSSRLYLRFRSNSASYVRLSLLYIWRCRSLSASLAADISVAKLPKLKSSGSLAPYAVVSLSGYQKQATSTLDTRKPKWENTLKL
jgi:hypothetical protein